MRATVRRAHTLRHDFAQRYGGARLSAEHAPCATTPRGWHHPRQRQSEHLQQAIDWTHGADIPYLGSTVRLCVLERGALPPLASEGAQELRLSLPPGASAQQVREAAAEKDRGDRDDQGDPEQAAEHGDVVMSTMASKPMTIVNRMSTIRATSCN